MWVYGSNYIIAGTYIDVCAISMNTTQLAVAAKQTHFVREFRPLENKGRNGMCIHVHLLLLLIFSYTVYGKYVNVFASICP